LINIVLFEPEIPPNTGNIIRLAANTGSQLHLIKPFGFDLDDKKMRLAGLDYHEFTGVLSYDNWQDFIKTHENHRFFGVSTKALRH
jgi:tRNA (cytidine/uridine-2'-O-)-methyltransferase|tara:strand:+ start:927 stop:1184 length:258 start_codon:yes stop_codon:yes gene_type:complete